MGHANPSLVTGKRTGRQDSTAPRVLGHVKLLIRKDRLGIKDSLKKKYQVFLKIFNEKDKV